MSTSASFEPSSSGLFTQNFETDKSLSSSEDELMYKVSEFSNLDDELVKYYINFLFPEQTPIPSKLHSSLVTLFKKTSLEEKACAARVIDTFRDEHKIITEFTEITDDFFGGSDKKLWTVSSFITEKTVTFKS